VAEYENFIQTDAAINRGTAASPWSTWMAKSSASIPPSSPHGRLSGHRLRYSISMARNVMNDLIEGRKVCVGGWE